MREELLNLVRTGVRCPENAKTCSDCQYHSTRYPMHCDEEAALVDMLIAHGVVIPVRCKGCKYWRDSWVAPDGKHEHGWCHLEDADDVVVGRWDDDFCSNGERRTE